MENLSVREDLALNREEWKNAIKSNPHNNGIGRTPNENNDEAIVVHYGAQKNYLFSTPTHLT